MTYEEIHDKIASGAQAESVEEITESLHKLVKYGQKNEQLLSIRLSESKRMMLIDKNKWASWATQEFGLKDVTLTHHRRNLGDLLVDLREENLALFKRFLGTPVSKMEPLLELYNKLGIEAVVSFTNTYFPNDDVTREQLRAAKDALLKKDKSGMEQMTFGFTFDAVREKISEEDLVRQTRTKEFSPKVALLMQQNSITMTRAAVTYLSGFRGDVKQELGIEPYQYNAFLLELESQLRDAANALREIAGGSRKRMLESGENEK